jgi:hypothetical protein
LRVAVRMILAFFSLAGALQAEVEVVQQLRDGRMVDRMLPQPPAPARSPAYSCTSSAAATGGRRGYPARSAVPAPPAAGGRRP